MISHLRRICDHLSRETDVDDAIQLFALNACYSGSPSRLFVGKLENDMSVLPVAIFGFDWEQEITRAYVTNLVPHLLKNLNNSDSVSFVEHCLKYQEFHNNSVGKEDSGIWKTTILMPMLPNYFGVLSTQVEVQQSNENVEYFNALRAIFHLYMNTKGRTLQLLNNESKPKKVDLSGVKLTERQQLILALVEEGHTNLAIADRLGYSESLIRQETITIYRKLGIEGRRDLQIIQKP